MPHQLVGLSDYGFWLSSYYNFVHFGDYVTSMGERYNYMQFPLVLIFFPLGYIKDTVLFVFLLNYMTYLSWFLISYILLFKKFSLKKVIVYFLLFFSSTTILFHYNLNYNGWQSVYLSVPLLMLSYYFAFVKGNYKLSILLYLPLLFIKVQFWLILFFLFIAFFIQTKKKKYIYFGFISLLLFFMYLKIQAYIFVGEVTSSSLASNYSYLFDFSDIKNIFIIMFSGIKIKVALIGSFFIQFLFLIDIKKVSKKDLYTYLLLIFPIFSYCFLSTRISMSYWTHEHYVLPVLPVVFLVLLQYGIFSKIRIFAYLIVNITLIMGIISLKQPWQFKYYQDELQLITKIKPILDLDYKDDVIAEERTGIYFTMYQVNHFKYLKSKTRIPKYVIFNTRYSYLADNAKLIQQKYISSYDTVNQYKGFFKDYNIIYLTYPFIVYELNSKKNLIFDKELLDEWDKKTVKSNKWFQ